jgi:hypothetical protein
LGLLAGLSTDTSRYVSPSVKLASRGMAGLFPGSTPPDYF